MRRFTESTYAFRVSLFTALVTVVAFVLPLAAFAGSGDPTGV